MDVVVVAIGSDSTEGADQVASHAEENGFEGYFAVPPQEMLNTLQSEYGPDIITPPTAPVILISADQSTARLLDRGLKDADDLRASLTAGF